MDQQLLIELLEKHLKQVEPSGIEALKIRLRRTIDRLKEGFYLEKDEDLIFDLQAVGFSDIAAQVRRGLYI